MAHDTLPPTADDSLPLRVVEVIRRRWMMAAAVFSTVLAAAVAFALYLPDLYRATALVLVERTISESVVRAPVSGELEGRLYVIKQEVLSRDRLTGLIDRFDLYPELRQRAGMVDVLTLARNDIVVEPAGPEQVAGRTKTVSFTLSYTSDNPAVVADVTNAVAAFYVQQNDRMRSDEAIQTTQFLRTQLADANNELDRHEAVMRDYTMRYAGELPQQMGFNLATLERLNTELRLNGERQISIIEQRDTLFDGLREAGPVARPTAEGTEISLESLERLRRLDEQRQALLQAERDATGRHPDVVRLQEQLAVMEREHELAELAETRAREDAEVEVRASAPVDPVAATLPLRRRTMESLDADLAALRDEESSIRETIASFEQRLASSPQREQEYQTITRDYNTSKELYDSLLQRYEEAQLTESVETDQAGERFRVLEPALPPEGPSAPNRLRLLLMGLLLAGVGAVGAVLVREQFDTTFHTVDDIRAFTSVPVLVSIPSIGPVPAGRRIRMALGTVATLAVIALITAAVAYVAHGSDQLVRLVGF